ncbi:hypothetical protein FN846DRAFT_993479 [Sphaerosporella brunnea]|uniref:JmjC domain-containing protein n=1 Tax=Sphaerosporella brunnea TaxID=1250544 RepID=A0A5J5END0_9PEZI|nr:hypothetical protein FN846DRAFT_993479 [Sphaerosporella brunnea]
MSDNTKARPKSNMSDNAKAGPKPKLRPCPFKYLGCKKRLHQHSVNRHARTCTCQPPPHIAAIWKELTGHCQDNHGFEMKLALKHWRQLKLPEEHTDLSVVPNEPVYIDMWPEELPSPAKVLQDMQATVNRALDTLRDENSGTRFEELQKLNDMLFEQMANGSKHLPKAMLRRLAVKAPTNMLSKYKLTVPPALEKMGVKRSLFNVNITHKFSITDIHLDSGCVALCVPLSGEKIVLLFKPEPPATNQNSVGARSKAWYDTWVARSVAGERKEDVSPADCEWFLSLAGQLEHPYIAKLSSTERKTLWIPAAWKHIVFTLSPSFLGGFTFVPQEHLNEMVYQIRCECQAVAMWEAENEDVLPEQVSADLVNNVNAAMQALNAEQRHKDPARRSPSSVGQRTKLHLLSGVVQERSQLEFMYFCARVHSISDGHEPARQISGLGSWARAMQQFKAQGKQLPGPVSRTMSG